MAGICGISLAQPEGTGEMKPLPTSPEAQPAGPESQLNKDPYGMDPARSMEPQCKMGMGPQCEMIAHQDGGYPMGVPLEVLYGGHGQALKGNESHQLRLKVEAIVPMQPGQIRDLLSSNKSLEEIRDDIRRKGEQAGEKAFRGSLILDRSMYPLENIAVTSSENASIITADLVDLDRPPSENASALGSISVTVSPSDGKMIGEGELNIMQDGGEKIYVLSLDMDPSGRRQMGRNP